MSGRTIATGADLAQGLTAYTRELLQSAHRELHELARRIAVEATPQGGAGDEHPGLMRRSWVDLPGSIDSAIARLQPTKLRNVAPQALIVDRGRRRSENAYRVRGAGGTSYTVPAGRMLGSERAPLGVKGKVLRGIAAQSEAIFAKAGVVADRKVGA